MSEKWQIIAASGQNLKPGDPISVDHHGRIIKTPEYESSLAKLPLDASFTGKDHSIIIVSEEWVKEFTQAMGIMIHD